MIRRALTNTGWLMGARGINAVLSLGYLALATRALGLQGFGQFILCVTFAQAITGLASFQTWQAVVRWGQRRDTEADAVGFALALDFLTVAAGGIAAAKRLVRDQYQCRLVRWNLEHPVQFRLLTAFGRSLQFRGALLELSREKQCPLKNQRPGRSRVRFESFKEIPRR